MPKDNKNIQSSIKKLEDIVDWFESQEDVDVEAGLKKVKTGSALIKDLKSRLKKVENEFEDIKADIENV